MTQKTYIIRKSAYGYTDEYYFEMCLGGITDTFTDEDAAYQRLTELEVPMFRSYDMAELEALTLYGGNSAKYQSVRQALHTYLLEAFGKSFMVQRDNSGYWYAKRDSFLSGKFTDEHIMKIREITGIRFHEMSIFEDEIVFYAIWLPYANKYYQIDAQDIISNSLYLRPANKPESEIKDAIYFFNSYEAALDKARQFPFRWWYQKQPISGKLDDLSDQPVMLRSFIETTIGITYDEATQTITLDYGFDSEYILGLNALLKQPLFEIREFPYEAAKDIPHGPFELM